MTTQRTDLVTFENTYLQTQSEFTAEDGDIFACLTIDGFPADENLEGRVVAEVFCTTHGDIVVSWHDNGLRGNATVLKLINESRDRLLDMKRKVDLINGVRVGDIIKKVIEDGHCIIEYHLVVGSIEREENGYLVFYGTPATEEDKEYAEEYGYHCNGEDFVSYQKCSMTSEERWKAILMNAIRLIDHECEYKLMNTGDEVEWYNTNIGITPDELKELGVEWVFKS